MKKTHNGKQVPFFHIFNKLSDSINFTQRLFLSFIFIAVPVMAALFIGSFLFLQSSIHQSIEQTQAIEVQKLNTQLLAMFNDIENISREMVYNSDIQKFMQDAAAGDPYPEDHSTAYYVNAFIANRDYINSMYSPVWITPFFPQNLPTRMFLLFKTSRTNGGFLLCKNLILAISGFLMPF